MEKWCLTQSLICMILSVLWASGNAQESPRLSRDIFKAEIFLRDKSGLNNGLYEGFVNGRKRFGGTQLPHGFGIINYFTDDKFHRLNYTGEWSEGVRSGNGTTFFRDGSVYTGEYKDGVEDGIGEIRYDNGNVLAGEFQRGKIHGRARFNYPNGNQREGTFLENILDGEVTFTEANGRASIEIWNNGKRMDDSVLLILGNSDPEGSTRSKFNDPNHFQPSLPFPVPIAPSAPNSIPDSSGTPLVDSPVTNPIKKVVQEPRDPGEQFFFGPADNRREPKTRVLFPASPAQVNTAAGDEFEVLRETSQKQDQGLLRALFQNVQK